MTTLIAFIQARRRHLLWLSGILLTYALFGFLLLPWIVESQLQKILNDRLSIRAEVESVYFNPFSFYFEIDELRLIDADQDLLLNLGHLQLNFQASRLALLKFQFSEINISELEMYYVRNSIGDDSLARLTQRWADSTETAAEISAGGAGLIPFEILSLSLSQISINIVDQVPITPFATTLTLAEAQVNNFSTLANQLGHNSLTLNFEENSQLTWSGGFSISPLDFDGRIELTNFSVLPAHRYLQDRLPFNVNDGHIDLAFNYDIDLSEQEPRIRIDAFEFSLNSLAAIQLGELEPFIEASSLHINDGELLIPENRVELDTLSLQGITINAVRDETGQINFQSMLEGLLPITELTTRVTSEEQLTEATDTSPWVFSLKSFSIIDNRIQFKDNSLLTPFTIAASVNASIDNIDNQPGSRFPVATTLGLDSGGEIQMLGEVQALPLLQLSSTLIIKALAINVAQAYVNQFTLLNLDSGTLDFDAEVSIDANESFAFQAGTTLRDVVISDQQTAETLFSIDSFGIDAMNFSLSENNIDISEILLNSIFAKILINEDGSSNIGQSLRSDTESAKPMAASNVPTSGAEPITITVGQIALVNARAEFTDLNLPLPFSANIQDLNGFVQGFANNSSQATDIDLEGQVGEFGLVQIMSKLNPFDLTAQSQIEVNFSNIDMPSMTPYTVKFAGREIAEGKVDLELSYNIVDGKLSANNQLVLSALKLGERIETTGAMDLPLDLAVALLKDGNGVIDFEIPITGDMNDPKFNFGPAIRSALSSILSNIVAAPFRLLGNLIGGEDDKSLNRLRFLPGRADLAAPEQEVLMQLGGALKLRPELQLQIPAISSSTDEAVLKTQAVDADIKTLLATQPKTELSLSVRRLAALESLYTQSDLQPATIELKNLHRPRTDADDPSTPPQVSPEQIDTPAYIADLRKRLIAAKIISEAELTSLASARRSAVVEYLINTAGVAQSQLLTTGLQVGELDEDAWIVLPFALSAQ